MRIDVRRARDSGRRLSGRRRAQRHRADVHRHRERADDHRRQGGGHAVNRLPQCVGIREGTGAGCRFDPDDRQDGAAGDDHPPPRCAPQFDDAEGVRRGIAGAVLLRRSPPERRCGSTVSGATPDMAHRVDDLLLPIVKGVGSERAYELLTESLQTLGGSGFLQDYPIEQYIRDAKIDSLYEGTTAIQALDLFFRKIVRDRGEALAHVAAQISQTIDSSDAVLKTQADQVRAALEHVQAMTASMTGYLMTATEQPTEIYKVGLASGRYLLAIGDLKIGRAHAELQSHVNLVCRLLLEKKKRRHILPLVTIL